MRQRWMLAALAALSLFATVGRLGAQDLTVSHSPERPRPGQDLLVTILVPGVEARDLVLEAGLGAAGMEFVSSTVTPQRGEAGLVARVELGYRILSSGMLSTGPITLRSGGRIWPIEALRIRSEDSAQAENPEPARWLAPDSVRLWSSFLIEAVDPQGRALMPASLAVPGLFTVPDPSGGFLAIAIESGLSTLPGSAPGLGGIAFAPRPIQVLSAPEALKASRALGSLALSLAAGAREASLDGAFSFELRIEGSGSLPMLKAPEFAVHGPQGRLPSSRIVLSRRDEYEAGAGEYRGSVVFKVDVLPLDAGSHRVTFAPYAVQDPASGLIRELRVAELRFEVLERIDIDAAAAAFEALKAASLAELGSSQAARLVQGAFVSRLDGDEIAFLRGLHAAERRPPLLAWRLGPPLKAALDAREAALRLSQRPSDLIGANALAPLGAALICALLACLGLTLRLALARRTPVVAPKRRALALACLVLVISGATLGFALLERRQDFCIVKAGAARVVPEAQSGPAFALEHATAARVVSRAGAWYLVQLEDGRSGWYPSDAVALY